MKRRFRKIKRSKNEVDKIEYVEKELHNRVDYLRDESKKQDCIEL